MSRCLSPLGGLQERHIGSRMLSSSSIGSSTNTVSLNGQCGRGVLGEIYSDMWQDQNSDSWEHEKSNKPCPFSPSGMPGGLASPSRRLALGFRGGSVHGRAASATAAAAAAAAAGGGLAAKAEGIPWSALPEGSCSSKASSLIGEGQNRGPGIHKPLPDRFLRALAGAAASATHMVGGIMSGSLVGVVKTEDLQQLRKDHAARAAKEKRKQVSCLHNTSLQGDFPNVVGSCRASATSQTRQALC